MILSACGKLPRVPVNDTWYRAIPLQYLHAPLSYAHTKKNASRFNAGPVLAAVEQFAILYFADDSTVIQYEVDSMLGTPRGPNAPNPKMSSVSLNVQVVLREVFDLTDMASYQTLGTSAQELTGDWEGYSNRNYSTKVSHPTGIAPTQYLGKALYNADVEGFMTLSAKVPDHRILAVFPEKLKRDGHYRSSLSFLDRSGTITDKVEAH